MRKIGSNERTNAAFEDADLHPPPLLISGAPSESGTNNGGRSTTAIPDVPAPSSGPQPQMTAAELRALIDGRLRPQLEKSVRQRRFEDELRLQQIMMTAGVSAGGSLS